MREHPDPKSMFVVRLVVLDVDLWDRNRVSSLEARQGLTVKSRYILLPSLSPESAEAVESLSAWTVRLAQRQHASRKYSMSRDASSPFFSNGFLTARLRE